MKAHINNRIGSSTLVLLCVLGMAPGRAQTFAPNSSGLISGPTPIPTANYARFLKGIRLNNKARTALGEGNYADAEDYARQSVALGIGSGFGQKLLAEALYDQGKYDEALPVYKAISDEQETAPRYELPYALLLLKTGQWAQAVTVYSTTLPFLNDGKLLRSHNQFSLSTPRTKDLATAIHIGLGTQYLNSADWAGQPQNEKAMSHFQKALALEPNSSLANYYSGYGFKRLGRGVQAEAAFKKAASLGQGDIREAAQEELPQAMRPK